MKPLIKFATFVIIFIVAIQNRGFALDLGFFKAKPGPWNLPVSISDDNTTINFQLDTSLHLVKGLASGVSGKIWLENEDQPNSIRAEIRIPVAGFQTGNSNRDEKIKKVMSFLKFPDVIFSVTDNSDICSPTELVAKRECRGVLRGRLAMLATSKQISLPIIVRQVDQAYTIEGQTSLAWKDFGIADPSTFIAEAEDLVEVSIKIKLG